MRYRDAAHVDVGSFYARLPQHGKMYRLLGHAGVAAVVYYAHCAADHRPVAIMLIVLVLAWLLSWYRVVGTLWRSSLVSAIIACAVLLTLDRVCGSCASCHTATSPSSTPTSAPSSQGAKP